MFTFLVITGTIVAAACLLAAVVGQALLTKANLFLDHNR